MLRVYFHPVRSSAVIFAAEIACRAIFGSHLDVQRLIACHLILSFMLLSLSLSLSLVSRDWRDEPTYSSKSRQFFLTSFHSFRPGDRHSARIFLLTVIELRHKYVMSKCSRRVALHSMGGRSPTLPGGPVGGREHRVLCACETQYMHVPPAQHYLCISNILCFHASCQRRWLLRGCFSISCHSLRTQKATMCAVLLTLVRTSRECCCIYPEKLIKSRANLPNKKCKYYLAELNRIIQKTKTLA